MKITPSDPAQTVVKALSLLDLVAPHPQGLGLNEISRNLSSSNSSTLRLVEALKQGGYIIQDPVTLKYQLGLKLLELGQIVINRLNITQIAQPYLDQLSNQIEETTHLGILDGCDTLFIGKCEPSNPIRLDTRIGFRCESTCTAIGKAILAFQQEDDLNKILEKCNFTRFSDFTITNPDSFRSELTRIRQNGYAIDNEEHRLGIRCIGAPIYNHQGIVVAAISVASPVFRLTGERTREVAQAVIVTAKQVSSAMGYLNN